MRKAPGWSGDVAIPIYLQAHLRPSAGPLHPPVKPRETGATGVPPVRLGRAARSKERREDRQPMLQAHAQPVRRGAARRGQHARTCPSAEVGPPAAAEPPPRARPSRGSPAGNRKDFT